MPKEENTYRLCKKCLMREMQDKAEYYESIGALIERLEPDTKVADELYEERLQICKECEMFLEAMCRSCGCYVELRAAKAKNTCPRKKW